MNSSLLLPRNLFISALCLVFSLQCFSFLFYTPVPHLVPRSPAQPLCTSYHPWGEFLRLSYFPLILSYMMFVFISKMKKWQEAEKFNRLIGLPPILLCRKLYILLQQFWKRHPCKWKSLSRVQIFATPGHHSPRNSPGQNTGVSSCRGPALVGSRDSLRMMASEIRIAIA